MGKVQALPDEMASTHGLFFGDPGDTPPIRLVETNFVKEFFLDAPISVHIREQGPYSRQYVLTF